MSRRRLIISLALFVGVPMLVGAVSVGARLVRPFPPIGSPVPSLAPTQRLLFLSERDGNPEIYVMVVDGSGQKNLTHNSCLNSSPAWSPDGQQIAFISLCADVASSGIFVMNSDGSKIQRVAGQIDQGYVTLEWSPDQKRLIVATFASIEKPEFRRRLHLIDVDGSGSMPFVPHGLTETDDCYAPRWSGDGEWIAFLCQRQPAPTLYVANVDGSELRRVGQNVTSFDWSPDSRKLAYMTSLTLFLFDVESSKSLALRELRLSDYHIEVRWSPDGARLLVVSPFPGDPSVVMMWQDGSGLVDVLDQAGVLSPRWSPDGKWIAYSTAETTQENIFVLHVADAVINPESLKPVQLTNTGMDFNPQWQP